MENRPFRSAKSADGKGGSKFKGLLPDFFLLQKKSADGKERLNRYSFLFFLENYINQI
jgi:hypothetical protein